LPFDDNFVMTYLRKAKAQLRRPLKEPARNRLVFSYEIIISKTADIVGKGSDLTWRDVATLNGAVAQVSTLSGTRRREQ
jgi:hypothetical protein